MATVLALGCATPDRVIPAPIVIPDDAATTAYSDLYPKVRQLAWRATEAYYRDDWKELSETAQAIEKAARILKGTKDAPARFPDLAGKCESLAAEAAAVRSAAAVPNPADIGAHLQRVHNLIRELRPDA
jgi:hypothetical protein